MLQNIFNKFYSPDEIGGIDNATPAGDGAEGTSVQKTFTQEELNRIIVREKEKATKSALKNLGFEDSSTAKEKLDQLRKLEESSQSDVEKLIKGKEKAERTLAENKNKISELETQLSLLKFGISPDKLSEANALISLKLSEDKGMEDAVKEVKIDFPNLFIREVDAPQSGHESGTGNSGNPPRNPRQQVTFEGIGQRLAEQRLKQSGLTTRSD